MASPSSVYPRPNHRAPTPAAARPQVIAAVRPFPTDAERFAMLWGSSEAGRRRHDLIELKRRAALVAIVGSLILALLLLAGTVA